MNRGNEQEIFNKVYKIKHISKYNKKENKFNVNDRVRISKYKSVFEKGYTPNWSTEIFTIYKVQKNTHPVTYLLKDYQNEQIKGAFYEQELQKVMYPDVYLIDHILRRNGNKVRVKWLGFDSTHNSWISKRDIL